MEFLFQAIGSFFVGVSLFIGGLFGGGTAVPVVLPDSSTPPTVQESVVDSQPKAPGTVAIDATASTNVAPAALAAPTASVKTEPAPALAQGTAPDLTIADERDDIPNVKQIGDSEFAKGKRYVYYDDTGIYRVLDADYATFTVLSKNLAKDKSAAFYRSNKIAGVDATSFNTITIKDPKITALVMYAGWAKDTKSVYCGGSKLAGSDASTFRFDEFFPVDKNNVYDPIRCGDVLSSAGSSFKNLGDGYAKTSDKAFLFRSYTKSSYSPGYYYCYYSDTYVVGADAELACYYTSGNYGGYTDWKVYTLAEVEHINSFEAINAYYAKDSENVYYLGRLMSDADPATFRITTAPNLARDKTYSYRDGNKDGETF